ncbi:HAD family hydrolase [Nocardia suismassiliense]|uniref:HAD family hydrolase n=1 Tax=Nocardia suismassiliense TaxID=2077092 RepID=A0ABW6R0W0_9NOCA
MNPAPRLLLLDFDGVIADSVDECAAVTWFADQEPSQLSLRQQFEAVPPTFVDRFHQLRPFSRTLDDFFVAKAAPDEPVTSQAEFDRLKTGISDAERTDFVAAATAVRHRWRATRRGEWLGAHTVFDGVASTLRRYSGNVYVITAKDAESSIEILEYFGLDKHVAGVIGEVSDKALAARCLCLGRGVSTEQALFIDDNLTNVARVQSAGVPSRWARWGWTTAEHESAAVAQGLVAMELSELAAL